MWMGGVDSLSAYLTCEGSYKQEHIIMFLIYCFYENVCNLSPFYLNGLYKIKKSNTECCWLYVYYKVIVVFTVSNDYLTLKNN